MLKQIFMSLKKENKEKRKQRRTSRTKKPLVDPLYNMFVCYFLCHVIHFMTEKDVKNCFSVKKFISTSKLRAEH